MTAFQLTEPQTFGTQTPTDRTSDIWYTDYSETFIEQLQVTSCNPAALSTCVSDGLIRNVALLDMQLHHVCATPTALASSPVTSKIQSRMPGAGDVVELLAEQRTCDSQVVGSSPGTSQSGRGSDRHI